MAQFQDIPLAADLLSDSQVDLRANFQYLQGALGKDHQVIFNHSDTSSFEGRHTQLSLNNNNVLTAQTAFTDGAQAVIFAVGADLAVTFNTPTYVGLATALTQHSKPPIALQNGYSWLAGQMLIQWGTNAAPGNGAGVQGFPTSFPNNCFVVLVTPKRTGSPSGVDQIYVQAKSTVNFNYFTTTTGTGFASFDFIAIGN